ncbi:MAG: hypothetical protein IID45_11290, partial [Planctomycetes bacterium]|nr:hypothetical protein [Planctomycetota bacterium]
VRLPEPVLCEILGHAGFDFVLIDGEHGSMGWGDIDRMTQGCLAGGTVPFVRLMHKDDAESVMRALDLGVQGILLPHCCTADDARFLQQAAFYPPKGKRGFGPGRASMWGRIAREDYFKRIDDSLCLFMLIEDPEGVENVEEIAAVGLDCLWVGTGDLAMSYGVPGERDHPQVQEAAAKILAACQKHDVAAGFPALDAEDAKRAREQGFRCIGLGGAENFVMQASRGFLSALGR